MDYDIFLWSRTVLETTPDRWLKLTQTLPAALLNHPPAPNEWSAVACLQHLVDTERGVFPVRVGHLLKGEDFPAFDPDSQGTVVQTDTSPSDLAQDFARMRAESLKQFANLSPADLSRTAKHSELGQVTLNELLHEWAGHDLMHTVQAEQALMQPFIAGCGPWQPYFASHAAQQG